MSAHVDIAMRNALAPFVLGRMHPIALPDDVTFPALVYSIVSVDGQNTMCGESDLDNERYRVDIYDKDYDNLVLLTRQIRTSMDTLSVFPYPAVCVGVFDLYEPTRRLYHRAVDFSIWAKKPTQ